MNTITKNKLEEVLLKRKEQNAFRTLKIVDGLVDFSSNDYLSIGGESPKAKGRGGAGGSRLLSGNYKEHITFEKRVADFHGYPSATLYNCGYMANLGVISALCDKKDVILYDEFIHASIRDGIKLSGATSYPFQHNNFTHLEDRLKQINGNVWIIVESVYSMDGDFAPLNEIAALKKQYDFNWIVDEAHAIGLFGNGKGKVAELELQEMVDITIVTYGKSLGASGAVSLSSGLISSCLRNLSKPFIYTTALSPFEVNHLENAYDLMIQKQANLQEVLHLIELFRASVNGTLLSEPTSFIQALMIPGNDKVKKLSLELFEQGLDVRPVLSPTVKRGMERLRICFHLHNKEEEVMLLAKTINSFLQTNELVLNSKS